MALKRKVTKVEYDKLVPELQAEYSQQGDEYHLQQPEGFVTKEKSDEFRVNNTELKRKIEELEAKTAGIDINEYNKLKDEKEKQKDKKLIDEGKIEELFAQRTERLRADYEGRIESLNKKIESQTADLKKSHEHLSTVLIDSEATKAINAKGQVRQGAMQDILARARSTWSLQENIPVPRKTDGTTIYGKDGKSYMTWEEWADSIYNEASYLFEGSVGGGAGPGGGGGRPAGKGLGEIKDASARLTAIRREQAGK